MKNLAIVFLSATLFSSSALASKNKVVGTYKGGEVTSKQIMTQFGSMLDMQPANRGKDFFDLDKNLQEALVKGYITQILVEKEADKLGLQNSKEFKEKLKSSRSQLLQEELIKSHLKTAVTDEMVEKEYKKLSEDLKGKKEIKVSHILVDTEVKAKEIKKELNKDGNKFQSLAKTLSKDEGSKANGGELGYVLKGQLVPEFDSKAFSMKKNEISEPVKTQFGWHIIRVLDIRDAKMPPKDQAIESIRNNLSREAMQKYFTKLTTQADISIKL